MQAMPVELAEQIEQILVDVCHKTKAECILLADISGQLLSAQGQMGVIDPVLVAALAAGDVAAMAELSRQIGEKNSHGSFLHEGEEKNIYLQIVADSFLLIVIFRSATPIGLVRLFARRGVERLYPLAAEFEEGLSQPGELLGDDFGAALTSELERAFGV